MNIIKKKRGNKDYYYLRYSYRKGSKVLTKEKYLGSSLPTDIESIKRKFKAELRVYLEEKLELIRDNFQKEWKRIPESAKERELKEIAISFTYNTNAIEGSTITLEETREIIESRQAPRKSLRDVNETEAHARVFLEMLSKKDEVTEELLLNWHKEVFDKTKADIAGRYRDYLVRIGDYRAPDWQDIKNLMQDLINFINKEKDINPVELSARVHYKFEKIHPFGDGNGRIGRLLMNYLLWHSNYPMIIIEYKIRKPYYNALKKDEDGFVKYFIRRYLTVHKKRQI